MMATNVLMTGRGDPAETEAMRADLVALADFVADLAKVINRLALDDPRGELRLMLFGVVVGVNAIAEQWR